MTQCGLHIPVSDGSKLPVFEKVMADIGDEQSIEQSLSTFSSHMTNIVQILKEAGKNALLLFDELGAGTDPVEGAALAIAIIEFARNRGAKVAATSHYAELKIYGTSTPGVMNASCEFDVETLKPTYRLITGIPGKSNAFAISERLGLPKVIISDAEGRIDKSSADFEEVLTQLEARRQQMEKEQTEIRKLLLQAEDMSVGTEPGWRRRRMDRFTGGCLCGEVRIAASGPPYRVGLCHCLDCRKHHGALFHASAVFPQDAVTIDGETRDYAGRCFCPRCGSSVFSRSGGEIEVNLGSMDAPDQLRPTYELWTVRRESWLPPFPLTRRYERDREAAGRFEE
jgi:hypothetical protein